MLISLLVKRGEFPSVVNLRTVFLERLLTASFSSHSLLEIIFLLTRGPKLGGYSAGGDP